MFMTLMYNAEAYHTRGSLRHVVGWTQMNRDDVFKRITINDYWASMLENWADSVKEYKKECEDKKALIAVCLPKMSKYFWRMLDAMFAAYNKLTPTLQTGIICSLVYILKTRKFQQFNLLTSCKSRHQDEYA